VSEAGGEKLWAATDAKTRPRGDGMSVFASVAKQSRIGEKGDGEAPGPPCRRILAETEAIGFLETV